MPRQLKARSPFWLFAIPFLYLISGCQINDYDAGQDFEHRENFLYTRAVAGKTELFVANINGSVTVIGVDTLGEARISGTKIVKDQSEDAATRHMIEIAIDVQESPSALTIKTLQPNTGGGRTYEVNYEILVPTAWKTTVANVNGDIVIHNFRNAVTSSVVNGTVNATDISASTNITATNGTINGKVNLPENATCSLTLVNGNVTLLVPSTLSASVSATVTLGTVSVTGVPVSCTTNTQTSVVGVAGSGKGTVRLSSVNGFVKLLGLQQY
ncbi:MAG: hypothetical protein NTU47_12245 [Ignavibacteriales bacterium]|nr:hypothetical protein [Ignavibacteriales bacterium]